MKRLSILILSVVFGLIAFKTPIVKAANINVPADYSTIQGAIDVVDNGDMVIVGLGTYVENIHFLGSGFGGIEPEAFLAEFFPGCLG